MATRHVITFVCYTDEQVAHAKKLLEGQVIGLQVVDLEPDDWLCKLSDVKAILRKQDE